MLPKDDGTPKVERLRVIQLFEADYNFVLRAVWGRRIVWSAQKFGIYMPAQRASVHCSGAQQDSKLRYDQTD